MNNVLDPTHSQQMEEYEILLELQKANPSQYEPSHRDLPKGVWPSSLIQLYLNMTLTPRCEQLRLPKLINVLDLGRTDFDEVVQNWCSVLGSEYYNSLPITLYKCGKPELGKKLYSMKSGRITKINKAATIEILIFVVNQIRLTIPTSERNPFVRASSVWEHSNVFKRGKRDVTKMYYLIECDEKTCQFWRLECRADNTIIARETDLFNSNAHFNEISNELYPIISILPFIQLSAILNSDFPEWDKTIEALERKNPKDGNCTTKTCKLQTAEFRHCREFPRKKVYQCWDCYQFKEALVWHLFKTVCRRMGYDEPRPKQNIVHKRLSSRDHRRPSIDSTAGSPPELLSMQRYQSPPISLLDKRRAPEESVGPFAKSIRHSLQNLPSNAPCSFKHNGEEEFDDLEIVCMYDEEDLKRIIEQATAKFYEIQAHYEKLERERGNPTYSVENKAKLEALKSLVNFRSASDFNPVRFTDACWKFETDQIAKIQIWLKNDIEKDFDQKKRDAETHFLLQWVSVRKDTQEVKDIYKNSLDNKNMFLEQLKEWKDLNIKMNQHLMEEMELVRESNRDRKFITIKELCEQKNTVQSNKISVENLEKFLNGEIDKTALLSSCHHDDNNSNDAFTEAIETPFAPALNADAQKPPSPDFLNEEINLVAQLPHQHEQQREIPPVIPEPHFHETQPAPPMFPQQNGLLGAPMQPPDQVNSGPGIQMQQQTINWERQAQHQMNNHPQVHGFPNQQAPPGLYNHAHHQQLHRGRSGDQPLTHWPHHYEREAPVPQNPQYHHPHHMGVQDPRYGPNHQWNPNFFHPRDFPAHGMPGPNYPINQPGPSSRP